MNCNLNGGRIYKGSIAQIDVFLYPACATGISGLVVNFYTVTGTSIEKTESDFEISGGVGTVVFQPVELEVFADGLLRYNVSYEQDGEPKTYDLETRWIIKTPNPYTPIDFVTTDNIEEVVLETITGTGVTSEIQEQIDNSISGKADSSAVTQSLNTKQDKLTAGTNIRIQNNVISVTGISVPTSNTAFTNDAGYITSSAIPTSNTAFTNDANYASTGEVQSQITISITGKQDTLVSGTNIKTVNNQSLLGAGNIEITSATPVNYTAGANISIDNGVISVTGITVPTSNTAFTNDAKYVTSAQTQTQINNSIAGKADSTAVTQSLTNKQDKLTAGPNIRMVGSVISVTGIPTMTSQLVNDSDYATNASIPRSNTALTNDAHYITAAAIPTSNTAFTNDEHFIKSSDIPTSNTAFTNDSGYVNSGQVQTQISNSITGKQDTLVSGTNIKTINNQSIVGPGNIEITGATPVNYTGGANISIDGNVISVTGITVPTSNTALTNDAGYITQAAIPTSNSAFTNDEGYVNSGEVQTQITEGVAGKQDTLVSGTNIKTINNQNILGSGNIEITSATPVNYTAGDNISIENGVISVTGISVPTSNTAFTNDAGYITESAIPTSNTAFTNDEGYITSGDIPTSNTAFTNDAQYITISDVPAFPTSNTAFTNDAGYITASDVPTSNTAFTNDAGYITSSAIPTSNTAFTNEAGYITESAIPTSNSAFTNDEGYITSGDIPTSNTAFTNDAEYITISSVPTSNTALTNDAGYVTSGEVATQITNSITGKQDTVVAGTNIDINNNIISVTGITSYTGVTSQEIITALGYTPCKVTAVTQTQYNQIQNKDANTIYGITD